MWRVYFSNENNFCFENLNQFYVFDYLFILNMDNLVYKGFAYTRHECIFEVLIYWIDIESHYSRPEMILMIDISSSEFVFVFWRCDIYIFPLDWCENQNIDRFICCDLASKTRFSVYMYQNYEFENSNPLIDWCLCCLFICLIILNHYA